MPPSQQKTGLCRACSSSSGQSLSSKGGIALSSEGGQAPFHEPSFQAGQSAGCECCAPVSPGVCRRKGKETFPAELEDRDVPQGLLRAYDPAC